MTIIFLNSQILNWLGNDYLLSITQLATECFIVGAGGKIGTFSYFYRPNRFHHLGPVKTSSRGCIFCLKKSFSLRQTKVTKLWALCWPPKYHTTKRIPRSGKYPGLHHHPWFISIWGLFSECQSLFSPHVSGLYPNCQLEVKWIGKWPLQRIYTWRSACLHGIRWVSILTSVHRNIYKGICWFIYKWLI